MVSTCQEVAAGVSTLSPNNSLRVLLISSGVVRLLDFRFEVLDVKLQAGELVSKFVIFTSIA